jgi:hypothetical protein
MESEALEQLKQLKPRQIAEHSKAFFAKYYCEIDVPTHQHNFLPYFCGVGHMSYP